LCILPQFNIIYSVRVTFGYKSITAGGAANLTA
jgi:hypothetical protein